MENKYIFGAYINLSVANFLRTINAIAQKYDCTINPLKSVEPASNENINVFFNSLFSLTKPIQNIEKIITDKFPWITPIVIEMGYKGDNIQANSLCDAYHQILKTFLLQLTEFRNFHTHYTHDSIQIKHLKRLDNSTINIADCLNVIYDGALNTIKTRFNADESEIAHLRRYKRIGRNIILRREEDGFYYCINNKMELTEKGIAFFTTLFLNREYAFLFLKKLTGFKRGDTTQYRMTLEVFTALSTRLPIERLKYEQNDMLNFSLDILNELSKVPIELFDTLSPINRKKYKDIDTTINYDSVIEENTRSRIRHRNRFEHFALTYLDQLSDFNKIGFYTYLGNYYHKGYPKRLIDNSTENRYINFQLAGFCKNIQEDLSSQLSQALNVPIKEINSESTIDNIINFEPYVAESNPHYIINNNNIGIKILPDGKNIYPSIQSNGAKMPTPDYWLSKYELPAMTFYAYLRENKPHQPYCPLSVMEIIENSANKVESVGKKETVAVLMSRRVEKAIFWSESKLKEIEHTKKQIAFGKKQYDTLKAGTIADTLARDILWLQPSLQKGKDKLTGANFQALQRAIAYYGSYRNELSTIFTRAGLIASNNQHPFLDKIPPAKYQTLLLFYKAYLSERKKYFESLKIALSKGEKGFQCYPLRDLVENKMKNKQSNTPIFLQRGLFNKAIQECLKKTKLNTYILNPRDGLLPQLNSSFLIKKYLECFLSDHLQPFYTEKRNYHFIDKETSKNKMIIYPRYLSIEERTKELEHLKPKKIEVKNANELLEREDRLYRKGYNEVCDNESIIRHYEIQDILLLLIAQKNLPKEITTQNYKLANIKGILNSFTTFRIKIYKNMYIEADNVRIKEYGKIYAIRYDTRFRKLMEVLNEFKSAIKEITFANYIKECEDFEKYRIEVIYLNHQFEQLIQTKYPDLLPESDGGYYNFRSLMTHYKTETNNITPNECCILTYIRNMFMHNKYEKTILKELIDMKCETIHCSEEIGKYYKIKMEEIIQDLKK